MTSQQTTATCATWWPAPVWPTSMDTGWPCGGDDQNDGYDDNCYGDDDGGDCDDDGGGDDDDDGDD